MAQEPEVWPYERQRNWGRWGDDDELGATNLIDADKRVAAARLVRSGRTVSLSRPFPTAPGPANPKPAQRYVMIEEAAGWGGVTDYFGIDYHGYSATHFDVLTHIWIDGKVWNGRDYGDAVTHKGVTAGDVEVWKEGIVTRGVLLDVPAHRGAPSVTAERPVHGTELEAIERVTGVHVEPGDAVFVHCGREAWEREHGAYVKALPRRPGLHASCRRYLRERDVAILGWDMMDVAPHEYDSPWAVHGILQAYGVLLLDSVALGDLAAACADEGRYEFMVVVAPLRVAGGSGSPVNPIAVL